MDISEMTNEQIEIRKDEIREEMKAENADFSALKAEVENLNARKAELKAQEDERRALAAKIESGAGEIKEFMKEERKMENVITRNSPEYIEAFANYIKSGDDTQVRSLLTENVSGTVAVPEIVDGIIRTAWEDEPILSRVRKTSIKGNVKVGFERGYYTSGVWTEAGSAATVHTEGSSTAVTEETLALGIVTMVPETLKKWVSVSDEVLDMDAGSFLNYIYSEIAYKLAQALSGKVVADILALTDAGSATAPAGYNIASGAATTAQIIAAMSYLCDEARNPVIICSKGTKAAIQTAALSAGYAYDPFAGLDCLTSSAAAGHIIVGDLSGYQINFPNGNGVQMKYDDLTLATTDLVRIIGRLPAAHNVVQAGHFVDVTLA